MNSTPSPQGSTPSPLPAPSAEGENISNNNSVNVADATGASNSSSSTARVNEHSMSFTSAVEAPIGAPPEEPCAPVSESPVVEEAGEIATDVVIAPARSADDICGAYIAASAHLVQRYLAYFDGTSATLRFCHGATVPTVTGLKTPEGFQDFTFAWSGIAFAVFRKILTDELPDKTIVQELTTPGISIQRARWLIVESLSPCVGDAIGSRRYDNTASYAKNIQESSDEMMRRWVEDCPALPSSLATRYGSLEDEIKSVEDLDAVLMQAMMMWVTSFFPFYQALKRQGGGADIAFFWRRNVGGATEADAQVSFPAFRPIQEPAPVLDAVPTPTSGVVVPDDDFLFSVYSFCSYENRMTNAEGDPRGCVVPRRWLQQFTAWLSAALRHGGAAQQSEEAAAAVAPPPGPMNTFACVELAGGAPNRHWLAKGTRNGRGVAEVVEAYEVIPEGLFDIFALRFGSGPKYMTYGPCARLSTLVEATRPQLVRATVSCTVANRPQTKLVSVIDQALLRTPLNELLRVALCSSGKQITTPAAPSDEEQTPATDGTCQTPNAWVQRILAADARDIELEIVVHPATETPKEEEAMRGTVETGVVHAILDCGLFLESGTVLTAVQQAYKEHNGVFVSSSQLLEVELKLRVAAESSEANPSVLGPGVCGLTNVGNTCYMNSALQALSNVTSFRRAFFSTIISRFPRATITQSYMQLMMEMWSGRCEYAETYALKRVIGDCVPRFSGYDQQDANELIEVLLDHLGEELNTVSSKSYRERQDSDVAIPTPELAQLFWDDFLLNNKSFIPREFFHQSKTVFTCLSCGEKTRVFDTNLTLGLPIKEVPTQKLVRVNVLVSCDVSALLCGDVASSQRPLPLTQVRIPVCPSVQVALQPDGTIFPSDLTAALNECLSSNEQLKRRILEATSRMKAELVQTAASTQAAPQGSVPASDEELNSSTSPSVSPSPGPVTNDVALLVDDDSETEEELPVELTFSFRYLEENMTIQRKPIVWADCVARPPQTESTTPPAAPAETEATTNESPKYRVWYFLQHKTAFNDFQRGALLYPAHVEELAAASPVLPTPPSASATVDEEGRCGDGGVGVLSRHILTVGQAIGDTILEFNNNTISVSAQSSAFGSAGKDLDGVGVRERTRKRSTSQSSSRSSGSSSDGSASASNPLAQATASSSHHHSSRDGDDERDAKSAPYSPLPNPVDICCASLRDPHLHRIADIAASSAGGDGWLQAEWNHAKEGSAFPKGKTNAPPTSSPATALPGSEDPSGPVNVLVFVCYAFSDARVVRDFSPLIISRPPLAREKDRTPQCSLHDSLSRMSQEEKLSDDDAWYCPRCKELRETAVKRTLFRLPPCLIMCFKRFKTNSLHAEKNNTLISFPANLDMQDYLDPEAPKTDTPTEYRLRSIVYHTGSLSYGHYTASALNDSVQKWVYYNDTRASIEESSEPTPSGAYILCYERIDVM